MFQTLFTFIKKYNNTLTQSSTANVFFFGNALTFSYKLTNWISYYVYVFDYMQSVTIRVYNKNWNKIFLSVFFSYALILAVLMIF